MTVVTESNEFEELVRVIYRALRGPIGAFPPVRRCGCFNMKTGVGQSDPMICNFYRLTTANHRSILIREQGKNEVL